MLTWQVFPGEDYQTRFFFNLRQRCQGLQREQAWGGHVGLGIVRSLQPFWMAWVLLGWVGHFSNFDDYVYLSDYPINVRKGPPSRHYHYTIHFLSANTLAGFWLEIGGFPEVLFSPMESFRMVPSVSCKCQGTSMTYLEKMESEIPEGSGVMQ